MTSRGLWGEGRGGDPSANQNHVACPRAMSAQIDVSKSRGQGVGAAPRPPGLARMLCLLFDGCPVHVGPHERLSSCRCHKAGDAWSYLAPRRRVWYKIC